MYIYDLIKNTVLNASTVKISTEKLIINETIPFFQCNTIYETIGQHIFQYTFLFRQDGKQKNSKQTNNKIKA
jgi:hypothetical protein